MTLYIHNTLTRKKEEFKPIDSKNVRMYVCGPTVYDYAHIGNARPIVVFDTLYRLLKRVYGDAYVTYVRNITDVEDKIMERAKENNESIETLTKRTTQIFHDDIAALNTLPPDIEPLATEYIGEMQAMIAKLIAKGHAYAAEGHVIFNVPSMPEYGKLSRHTRDELVAGARVEVAPYKKDAADFVLWKPSAPDQVGWDSPWGRGRPGWHIECSAMAEKNLGVTFDIHCGGLDLIFPHHENEIAQSRCSHDGAPLANYWMHNGFLTINNDKMSKSLKNFYTIHELLDIAPGEALRLALLSGHYRSPLDFSIEALKAAKTTLDRWYGALTITFDVEALSDQVSEEVEAALLDDLNTPEAITIIHKLADEVFLAAANMDWKEKIPLAKAKLLGSARAIGLLQQDHAVWRKWQPANKSGPTEVEIDTQIAARLAARKAKNFAESDRIRDALAAQGIILEDSASGTTWRRG